MDDYVEFPAELQSETMPTQEEIASHFSYLQNVSYNDIVPDDYQHRLMAIDSAFTVGFFEMGDIANDCLESVPIIEKKRLRTITQVDVFAAVGYFCRRSARTVRYYAETCRFYPKEVRKEFEDLSFSYFVLARRFKDRWRDVLEFAQENIHMNVDQVEDFFNQDSTRHQERVQDAGAEQRDEGQEAVQVTDPDPTGYASLRALKSVLSGLSASTSQLTRLLRSEQVDQDIKQRVYHVLDEISDIVQDVRDML